MAEVEDTIRRLWPALKDRVASLEDRKRLLLDQIREIETEIERARNEFLAIDSAAKALGTNFELQLSGQDEIRGSFEKLYKFGDVTIKQAARLTLAEFTGGLSSHDLFTRLNRRYFEDRLERTSFSPQLTRLNRDHEIILVRSGWVLTEKGSLTMGRGPVLPYRDGPETNEPPSM